MKINILIFLLCLLATPSTAQLILPSVFNSIGTTFQNSSTGLDINIGEPITGHITAGNHQITQGFLQPNLITLDLKVYLQGFYTGQGLMNNYGIGGCLFVTGNSPISTDADSIRLTLITPVSYSEVETATTIMQTDGSASFDFHKATQGYYYLKVNHRNTLETWSANPVSLVTRNFYDFTTTLSRAYGGNMIETFDNMGWAFYSGDISDPIKGVGYQDGIDDFHDYLFMENAVYNTFLGYLSEDITGDGIVESNDYVLMENNKYYMLTSARP